MSKKLWICVMVLCMLFSMTACGEQAAQANTEPERQNEQIVFSLSGTGTEDDPYLIATKEELIQFAAAMNDDELYRSYYDSHFRLTADIEMNDCSGFDAWDKNPPANTWTPIGYYHGFKGVFDGNGHTISGLYIDQAVAKDENNHVMDKFGLFGTVDGEIKNLSIEKAYIHPKDVDVAGASISAGILAGSSSGIISGCAVEGTVICEGYEYGGIVGSGSAGEIIDCTFTGKMVEKTGSSVSFIGGIAGSSGSIIRNCSVSAQIVCEESGDQTISCATVGGIAGIHSSFGSEKVIENCTFDGEIVRGDYAGGIVGHAGASSFQEVGGKTIIRNCTNNGSVTAAKDTGGIVGLAFRPDDLSEIQVDSCVNLGQVRSLDTETCATGGIVGLIDTIKNGPVIIANCVNEAELRANMPGGIIGRLMQNTGNVHIKNCTNKSAIYGEGLYAAGILCHVQQWGGNWNIVIDQCVNEADITTSSNAGGIVCFAYSVGNEPGCALNISNCTNRGNLRSEGSNNYMGGILGVDSLAYVPVSITGCTNEGDLEYTSEVLVDAETLSGALITLSRTSGGIVGYVGSAPYITVNSGERKLNNINVDDAYLNIANCSSTGKFIHKEAAFADDVDEDLLEKWKQTGVSTVLDFFIALEGGVIGTVADEEAFSVKIADCTFENAEHAIDDWIPHNR